MSFQDLQSHPELQLLWILPSSQHSYSNQQESKGFLPQCHISSTSLPLWSPISHLFNSTWTCYWLHYRSAVCICFQAYMSLAAHHMCCWPYLTAVINSASAKCKLYKREKQLALMSCRCYSLPVSLLQQLLCKSYSVIVHKKWIPCT